MKGYLFDGNVPSRLRFSPKLPIIPLSNVGRHPSDSQIWDFARKHDLVIVSKDTDFSDRIITSSPPPRVVHLRFGNLRRNEYHALLTRRWQCGQSWGAVNSDGVGVAGTSARQATDKVGRSAPMMGQKDINPSSEPGVPGKAAAVGAEVGVLRDRRS